MTSEEMFEIRDQISALLLSRVEGDVKAENAAIDQASKQLYQLGGLGGATRRRAETEIVRLVRAFDDTRDSSWGPWPVSAFMLERDTQAIALRSAIEACIAAHMTGRYEPMIAAIEAAQNLIKDTTPRRA